MGHLYKSLAKSDAEIRVALLQPGSYDADICVSFQKRILKVSIAPYTDCSLELWIENYTFHRD
jgi:hypothetical protein